MHKLPIILALLPAFAAASPAPLDQLRLAPGYTIEVYAADVPGARSLAQSPAGVIFVGTRGKEVFALKAGKKFVIASDLDAPNGVAFKNGDLFVAETSRLLKFPAIESHLDKPGKPQVIYAKLPTPSHHGWRYMRFAPDGLLYMGIGAPCNICNKEEEDPRFAAILRFPKLDGSAPEVFAKGIRNTVGFDWHPKSRELWFTDNGRDMMGDDLPDCELNHAPKAGGHYGYPFCHAGDVADPEFGKTRKCAEFLPPAAKLGAHVAPLGMRFVDDHSLLIAEHGSWNRTQPIGYRVVEVVLDEKGRASPPKPVLEFMLANGGILGRPVDLEKLADGSVLISDDQSDAIYRLRKKSDLSK